MTEIPLIVRAKAAQAWKPKPDRTEPEILQGTVVMVYGRTSEYGSYPVVVVDAEDSGFLLAFHAFHQVAIGQLKELKPSPGEAIAIVAHPKRASNNRKDAQGNPVVYSPYDIYNPDQLAEVGSNWTWDDLEADLGPGF